MKNKKNGRKNNSVPTAKKAWFLCLSLAAILAFSGCKTGKEHGKNTPDGTNIPQKNEDTVSQDYPRGGSVYMLTEKGAYLWDAPHMFWYYDFVTGKELPLCNKPECRHDGNVFCIASNAKYNVGSVCLYGGKLYYTGIEETETQYLYKLLTAELDGSEMQEIVTYMTLEKTDGTEGFFRNDYEELPRLSDEIPGLMIHRNKVFLPIQAGRREFADDDFKGTAIYDLSTKKLHYLEEESLAKNNKFIFALQACGNTVYYCTQEKRKTVLHKYDILSDTVQDFEELAGFHGVYAAIAENTIMYSGAPKDRIYFYDTATGVNEPKGSLTTPSHVLGHDVETGEDEIIDGAPRAVDVGGIATDGEYLYITENLTNRLKVNGETVWEKMLYVYDTNLNVVAKINLVPIFDALEEKYPELKAEEETAYRYQMLYSHQFCYTGENIYFQMEVPDGSGIYGFQVKRSDFLAGNSAYELVYKHKTEN